MAAGGSTNQLQAVVAFVGAGISAPAKLPDFAQLRTELFAEVVGWRLITNKARQQMEIGLKLLAPEYAVSLLDRAPDEPRKYICERLSTARPTAEHRLLAAAATVGARVYTPNFDRLIEDAEPDLTVSIRDGASEPDPDAQLLKLHGSCPQIMVSAEDVLLSIAGPWADAFLADCRKPGSHLLVWGYQGADPDLAPLVQAGAAAAGQCTWIAFTTADRAKAEALLSGIDTANVAFVDKSTPAARGLAAAILDPDGTVTLDDDERQWTEREYRIVARSTRASAISHLGSARLGRLAWFDVALHGNRSALQRLVRSYLFDSSIVQAVALSALPPILARKPRQAGWTALLVAAEGHGVRERTDRILSLFLDTPSMADGTDDAVLQAKARVATLLRNRGRLQQAQELLDSLQTDISVAPADSQTRDATWTGRLLYERSIVARLRGTVGDSEQILYAVDTLNAAIVGANWTMWLEDEHCSNAIARGDVDRAQEHLKRAIALAVAYGEHRLASADLGIRKTQIQILVGADLDAILAQADTHARSVRRTRVLTPLRRAWIDGVCADAARLAGPRQYEVANRYHRKLLKSPHLVHLLAAAVGLQLCGEALPPDLDLGALVAASGSTEASQLLEAQSGAAVSPITVRRLEELNSGRGLLFAF